MSDTALANTRVWDALCKTDPKHTKKFTRAGGFSGTAIKPIYNILRMTEQFGPCGIGWGMDKPEFTTHTVNEEVLVFCTACVWYTESGSTGRVYGVGGDKVLVKQKDSLRASDEAYKMAYTDALGNAIKNLGVSADVHMGLFDDSKYVKGLESEFAEVDPKELAAAQARNTAALSQVRLITPDQVTAFKEICKTRKLTQGFVLKQLKANKPKAIDNIPFIPSDEYEDWCAWAREAEMPDAG